MNKFMRWYWTYYTEITWFIIGFLTWAGLNDFAHGDYLGAICSFGLAYLNYYFSKRTV